MQLTVHTFLTVDGVMQSPGGADEDTSGGFSHGGWLVPLVDQDFGEIVTSWFSRTEAILLGHKTYRDMSGYWPQVTDPGNVVAATLNGQRKYVAASTLRDPEWQPATVLSGDVLKQIRQLKRQPGGKLQVHGSAALAQALHRAGLVDEYRLLVFPVTVENGKRLFTDDAPACGYTLADSRTTPAGVVYSVLRPRPFESGRVELPDGGQAS